MKEKHNILIIADTNFRHSVKDYDAYVKKLSRFLITKNEEKDVVLSTVAGKYRFNDAFNAIEIDDKNKTSFVKTVGDYLNKFDEVVIVTNYLHESYLESLRGQLNEENKATTIFSYEVRQ